MSLGFEKGRVHAVIGPNGAGKSTFLNLLSGELRATSGRVLLRGRDVTRASRRPHLAPRRRPRYQTANVFAGALTCAHSVWLAAQSRLRSSMRFFRAAEKYAEVREPRRPGAARAAAWRNDVAVRRATPLRRAAPAGARDDPGHGAALMLLDEPLAGLSAGEAQSVVALLRELRRERTLVLVEHDMDAVFRISDSVTVMVYGRVLVSGGPDEIRKSAAVRDAYLGGEVA